MGIGGVRTLISSIDPVYRHMPNKINVSKFESFCCQFEKPSADINSDESNTISGNAAFLHRLP